MITQGLSRQLFVCDMFHPYVTKSRNCLIVLTRLWLKEDGNMYNIDCRILHPEP